MAKIMLLTMKVALLLKAAVHIAFYQAQTLVSRGCKIFVIALVTAFL